MTETERLADLLDRVIHGDPWHGPNLADLLARFDADRALRVPDGGTHSAWHLVLHMTGWAKEVHARIAGRAAGEPEQGDWPEPTDRSAHGWEAAKTELFAAHAALAATVRTLVAVDLDQPVTDYRDNALGTGLSRALTLHGLVHHTVYHSGQLAMLARLVA